MKLHGEEVKVGDRLWDYAHQKWIIADQYFLNLLEIEYPPTPRLYFWQEVPPITPPPKPKPEIDWSKVPEGTLVRVRDGENDYWMVGEFLGLYKNGKYIYRIKDTYPDNDPAFIQIKLHESVEPKEEWMK